PYPLRGVRVAPVWVRADRTGLTRLASLAEEGVLTPRVAETLPLAEAAKAHRRLAGGGLRGRLVLVP
ncbi:zinc-binding dehydrogenase, partial [Streptomyces sp. NPDC056049]